VEREVAEQKERGLEEACELLNRPNDALRRPAQRRNRTKKKKNHNQRRGAEIEEGKSRLVPVRSEEKMVMTCPEKGGPLTRGRRDQVRKKIENQWPQ